ncbi:MAG: hypothetical protein LBQ16_04760 [Gracilibacteraceae bacterium]|jgi:diacylglycerol kinase family enzyme|nr:hypothetical protein [Gracilibacteraceae bacterium]
MPDKTGQISAVPRRHLFVVNPRSFRYDGGTDVIAAEIESFFKSTPDADYRVHISRYPRDAIGVIQKYFDEAPPETVIRVYAVGGDGILFDCLNGVVGLPNAELAAVPCGGAHDFIRSFGEKKQEVFRDIGRQITAGTLKTDVMRCGGNYAMNLCLVGLEAAGAMQSIRASQATERHLRSAFRWFMPAVCLFSSLSVLLNKKARMQRYEITIDGEIFHGRYGGLNIANGPGYCGDKSALPAAAPDDGILDVLFYKCPGVPEALRKLPDYLNGRYRKHPDLITYRSGREISVRSDSPLCVNLDGEVFFDTVLDVNIVPGGVNFVAPDGLRYARRKEPHEQ